MSETRAIFFWLSGVYTQPLLALLAQSLSQACGRPVNPLALPNYAAQVEWLSLGKMDDLAFCQALGKAVGAKNSPAALRDRILEGVIPNQGVSEISMLLPKTMQRWLVVDLPAKWFQHIEGLLGLHTCFSPDRRIFLPSSYLERLIPDVFDHLAIRAQLPLQECLLIDASTRRAVKALNHGLHAEIYVDNRRLERALVLRRLIDRPQPVHKPATTL
jgi:hypothetical protein